MSASAAHTQRKSNATTTLFVFFQFHIPLWDGNLAVFVWGGGVTQQGRGGGGGGGGRCLPVFWAEGVEGR